MSIIKWEPQAWERFEQLLDSVPHVPKMDADTLKAYRERIEQAIGELNALEPRSQTGEDYDHWADLHEELEDILDEILDCLEDMGAD